MLDSIPVIAPNEIDSFEKSVFTHAEQGTLELGDLMAATERLNASGVKDKSAELYRVWLEHTTSPLAYVACFNLGTILSSNQDYHKAEVMYRKALALNPNLIQARLNLGTCLEQQKRSDEALDQWRMALATDSIVLSENKLLRLHALNNLGRLLEVKRQYQAALAMLENSFAVDPTQRDVLIHLVHLAQKVCKWPIYSPPQGTNKLDMIKYTSPLAMLAISDDPDLQLAVARRFVEYKYPVTSGEALAPKEKYQHKKIRIGYLSSDLSMHAVSLLTVELFERHDREKFEVYGFCWSREDGSAFRQRVIAGMDHFIRIGQLDDRQAAVTIRAHEIDIIVDLQGLTSGARPLILSYRPAPMQITYLGFPGPTGLPWIDYVVADRYLIPENTAQYFTEKPLYMPGCFQVSDSKREVASMPSRAEYFLPEDAFVFCSFNNNYKYTPEMFAVWMRILKKVPKSVFWLLADNEWAQENLIKAAKKHGIKKDRLIFAPRVVPAAYLARYQLADLFLDTFPFNGGTTANDALFMGLPLLTLSGRSLASRYAGSLLINLGLPELITKSFKEYEDRAVHLAKNTLELNTLGEKLAAAKTAGKVFDSAEFALSYEKCLTDVYSSLKTVATGCEMSAEKTVLAENPQQKVPLTEDQTISAAVVAPNEAMGQERPFFSIIIPTHKRAVLLRRALTSIKGQNSPAPYEVIVVSDVSDPATDAVCNELLGNSDIVVRRNGAPGPSASRNLGLSLAKGRYVMFLDDDDAWHQGFLAQLYNSPQIVQGSPVYFNCTIVKERRLPEGPQFLSEKSLNLATTLTHEVYVKNQVHMSCFAFPRWLIQGIEFDGCMRAYEDWEYCLSVFDRAMPAHIDILGSQVFEVDDETTDRRGSSEGARGLNAVLDYLYVYRRHPAPSELIRVQRAELIAKFGLQVNSELL